MKWLQKIFPGPQAATPLRGRPTIRREKSYSAQTGYVYQYFYEGFHETHIGDDAGQVYFFSVSSDRVARFPIRIFLNREIVSEWQATRQRELNATEQYALVKMALFAMFDRQLDLADRTNPTSITYQEIDEYAETLALVQ